jgi:hypothetical protein
MSAAEKIIDIQVAEKRKVRMNMGAKIGTRGRGRPSPALLRPLTRMPMRQID